MPKQDQNLIVGLDIGTTKICCVVADLQPDGRLDIIGIGTHSSRGLRKGVVIDIDSTVESMRMAVEEAEMMAGVEINMVYAGIAGGHIKSGNSNGVVATKNNEVTAADIQRVLDAARAQNVPLDREIIHVIPQEFILDGQDGIKEPLGMSGVRLEARVHIVTGAVASAQNIIKCINRCGLDVGDIILEQLASAETVLTSDEKELGVCLLDIGGGTTDIAIFSEGHIKHTAVLAIGGDHITNDIAVGLRTPTREAEALKRKYGCALSSLVDPEETIDVPSIGERKPRTIARHLLAEIIEPRVEELFTLVSREVTRSGFEEQITAGVVLTGGSAITEGMVELAEEVFNKPVRRGLPQGIGGLTDVVSSPIYSTAVGLVQFASLNEREMSHHFTPTETRASRGVFQRLVDGIRNAF
ncbi:MAG: cell division protein FtsA [Magnetococcales bacterium]|nr:cell division protein FtsA [Magnetococcales bacterium]MBF0150864.1 cell division protein FtsA [Magnetococcales bacterium]MBF0173859.1 cell division protein FtsA [Magnetococcales bacterium]MBF0347003.1 cell division protein FtsA [Magnetococcales bacterium]MBF0631323.1 cell division protein FtsA [Magnetococcales bacterium]